jgi:KipI family sensor histidine kinase inhibitor
MAQPFAGVAPRGESSGWVGVSIPAAFRPLGDSGLLIELEGRLDPEINGSARAIGARLASFRGVIETVPALRSTLVIFDPLSTDVAALLEAAEGAVQSSGSWSSTTGRLIEVPVVYGGAAGPDLEETAAHCGLTVDQVVREHAGAEYSVYMLGFTPGYPYLGILPPSLRLPRLAVPRLKVPAGAVAIAGALAGIYPMESPGGWRLIGRTPLPIYDPQEADPVLLRSGDRIRFTPIARATFSSPSREAQTPHPARPAFAIRSGGLYTTVQDHGRPGYRRLGIPNAGAMDAVALRAANRAAGNMPDAAALEFTTPGPVLRALDDTVVALAGADLSPMLDAKAVEPGRPLRIRRGQVFEFGAPRRGMWCYLAVLGGIDVRPVLGSRATFAPGALGGTGGRRLREGDLVGRGPEPPQRRAVNDLVELDLALPGDDVTVRVIPGPQDEWLTEGSRTTLLRGVFTISLRTDRAGARLDGPTLAHGKSGDFLSDGLVPGSIQIPSGGQPIIILPDGPTTGGYPKAAAVITADLRLVAQSRPGTRVRFQAVSMEEAVDALRRQRAILGDGRGEKVRGCN